MSTLQQLVTKGLKKNRDRVFAKIGDREVTYQEADTESNRVANAVRSLGYGPNDRAVIILPNSEKTAFVLCGLIKSGMALVTLNIMLSEREIGYILKDSDVKLLFVDPKFYDLVSKIKEEYRQKVHIVAVGEEAPEGFILFDEFIAPHSSADPGLNAAPEDEALIAYTGGTTGTPKGVVHTQRGMFFDLLAHLTEFGWHKDERILIVTPLAHAAGLLMLAGLVNGATHIIEGQFDPFRALDLVESEKITITLMVPTIIYLFLDLLKHRPCDLSSFRTILYGAAPIAEERLAEALEVFGPVFEQVYGQVECPNMIAHLTSFDHIRGLKEKHILQSCGRPSLLTEVRILNEEGQEVPLGSSGEIAVKAPYVMKGYHNLPEATAAAFTADGWLLTGDMGRMDEEGYLYIVDRKKDMIITGGMNVYSIEVEEVIYKHPKVSQVAVVGIPDPKWGEAVTAFVVPEGELDPEEILEYCRDKMAKYMCPKKVFIQNYLPLTLLGKVNKAELRAPFWEGRDRKI